MAIVDGTELRWVPDNRLIGWKTLWLLRIILGAFAAWSIFVIVVAVIESQMDAIPFLLGRLLGIFALYWVGLRLASGVQTPSDAKQVTLTEGEVEIEDSTLSRVIVGQEPGTILTDREIRREANKANNEGWWNETAEPLLRDSESVEQADSTGRRWRIVESSQ